MKRHERFHLDPTQINLAYLLSESSKMLNLGGVQDGVKSSLPGSESPLGSFSPKEIIAINLVVSTKNGCQEDLETYMVLAEDAGFSKLEIMELCAEMSVDCRLGVLVKVTSSLVDNRGFIDPELLEEFSQAGWSKDTLVELIGILCLCNISNYLTNSKAA